jgi:hypothetical protein
MERRANCKAKLLRESGKYLLRLDESDPPDLKWWRRRFGGPHGS